MELKQLKASVEAVLFACADPISASYLAELLETPEEDVCRALLSIGDDCADEGRGVALLHLENRWQLATKNELAPLVRRALDTRRNTPLSPKTADSLPPRGGWVSNESPQRVVSDAVSKMLFHCFFSCEPSFCVHHRNDFFTWKSALHFVIRGDALVTLFKKIDLIEELFLVADRDHPSVVDHQHRSKRHHHFIAGDGHNRSGGCRKAVNVANRFPFE